MSNRARAEILRSADVVDTEALGAARAALIEEITHLTLEEVAEVLRCGKRTVEQLIHDGELPYMRFGRRNLVAVSVLRAYIAERTVGAA